MLLNATTPHCRFALATPAAAGVAADGVAAGEAAAVAAVAAVGTVAERLALSLLTCPSDHYPTGYCR